jgi:hypothetical protein
MKSAKRTFAEEERQQTASGGDGHIYRVHRYRISAYLMYETIEKLLGNARSAKIITAKRTFAQG